MGGKNWPPGVSSVTSQANFVRAAGNPLNQAFQLYQPAPPRFLPSKTSQDSPTKAPCRNNSSPTRIGLLLRPQQERCFARMDPKAYRRVFSRLENHFSGSRMLTSGPSEEQPSQAPCDQQTSPSTYRRVFSVRQIGRIECRRENIMVTNTPVMNPDTRSHTHTHTDTFGTAR